MHSSWLSDLIREALSVPKRFAHRDIVLQKHTALLQRKIALMKKGMLHFCFEYCMRLLAGMGMLMYIVITLKTSRISCKN